MGAISGLLGTAGGVNGTGIQGPQGAPIMNPVTPDQIAGGQTGVNNSLDSQNNLLKALGAQNGTTNQSQVFNQSQTLGGQIGANNGAGVEGAATGQQQNLNTGLAGLNGVGAQGAAMGAQGNLTGQLGGANGVGAQVGGIQGLQNVLAQQQGLAGQLQGVANGTGPNPAQAALNQATGANVANQAALMAGQRGAGANVGLLARQAAQQGAATQQQAAGQGATMQAQQELNAMNALQGQQQAMAGTNQSIVGAGAGLTGQQQGAINNQFGQGAGAVGQLQTGIGQQYGQGAGDVGQQQTQQGISAGIAGNQVGNQIGATNSNVQNTLANAGQLYGVQQGVNSANVGSTSSVNSANAGLAGQSMKGQQAGIGGLLNAAGQGASMAAARGGMVNKMADGGVAAPAVAPPSVNGPISSFGQFLQNYGQGASDSYDPEQKSIYNGMGSLGKGIGSLIASSNKPDGDSVAGPDSSDMSTMGMAAKGGMAKNYVGGGKVKADSSKEKAVAPGNSYKNDKIKALLSEGEVVIPRDVMQSKDPARGAAEFVAKVLAKRKTKKA